jgi:uncharacterized protein YeaO (DUF488 family)
MRIKVKRAYEDPLPSDGLRVLVDRLWPRGVRRDTLALDRWLKDVAPSTSLRKWYGHTPDRFPEFAARYRGELQSGERSRAVDELRRVGRRRRVTLVTATRDLERSGAKVLAEVLNDSR